MAMPFMPPDHLSLLRHRLLVPACLSATALTVVAAAAARYLDGGVALGNDNSSHLAEIVTIADHLRAGRTDFWFPWVNLGYPLFVTYQPAPSLCMGVLVALTRDVVAPSWLFKASIVALWAAMPTTWYLGGRRLGMSR